MNEKMWVVKIEHLDSTAPDENELCVKLPDELMEALGWEIGDEVEWEQTEIWDDHGEHLGYTLKNLTKESDGGDTKWYNCAHCDAGYPDQECTCGRTKNESR